MRTRCCGPARRRTRRCGRAVTSASSASARRRRRGGGHYGTVHGRIRRGAGRQAPVRSGQHDGGRVREPAAAVPGPGAGLRLIVRFKGPGVQEPYSASRPLTRPKGHPLPARGERDGAAAAGCSPEGPACAREMVEHRGRCLKSAPNFEFWVPIRPPSFGLARLRRAGSVGQL